MWNRASRMVSLRLGIWAIAVVGLAARSEGGPAKYDPATRSFNLTYTYAALPASAMTPDQIDSLGELQKATEEQDAKIRGLQQAVSQIIFQVTDGRAKIGSLEAVDSVKKADIIVSLTGDPGRGGWAIPGAIEGRPGQVGLYYMNLISDQNQDMVYTVAHELCHYLFGLPDEYSNGTACPLANPQGPGCLMDNYFNRHGFLELCRDDSHNPSAPNPGTVIATHKTSDSCRFWVDKFFETHPPGPATSGDSGGTTNGDDSKPAPGEPAVTAEDPFSGKFQLLINSTTSFVRTELAKQDTTKLSAAALASLARRKAEDFLKKQLPNAAEVPGYVPPTRDQYKKAVDLIVKSATSGRIKAPARFSQDAVQQLRTKARELAAASTRRTTSLAQVLLTGQGAQEKDLKPIIDAVKRGLLQFLQSSVPAAIVGSAPRSSATRLTPEEQKYIEQIARDAVVGSAPSGTSLTTLQEAALWHIRLSINATQTLNALASELDIPGSRLRNANLNDLEQQLKLRLKDYALPGKPFAGFGFRRTSIIAPRPQDPANDYLALDSGDRIPYEDVRKLVISEMVRLLQRERIQVVDDPAGMDMARVQAGDRFLSQVKLFSGVIADIRRNRLENLIIIAPPGGLSQELGDILEDLRRQIVDDPYSDLRIDLVLYGTATVPLRLRDLVTRTGGIVQTYSDVDEIGAIAQRIKNDLAAGSWITIPQQGIIDLSQVLKDNKNRQPVAVATARMPLDKVREEFLGTKDTTYSLRRRAQALEKQQRDPAPETFESAILPTFPITYREIEQFTQRLNLFMDHFVRTAGLPESYGSQVGGTVARLAEIQRNFEEMSSKLRRLEVGGTVPTFHEGLHELKDLIDRTRLLTRRTLGLADRSPSPLKDTDDYFVWDAKRSLVAEANRLIADLHDIDPPPSSAARSARLNKAGYFLQRASESDQKLTDLRRNIYTKDFNLFRFPRTGAQAAAERLRTYSNAILSLRLEAERVEKRQSSWSPQTACQLLQASRIFSEKVQIDVQAVRENVRAIQPDQSPEKGVAVKALEVKSQGLIGVILDLEKVANLLDLASSGPVNVAEVEERLTAMETSLADVRTLLEVRPDAQAAGANPGQTANPQDLVQRLQARLAPLQQLDTKLRERLEQIRNLRAANGTPEPAACAPDDRTPPQVNALSPLRDSLKLRRELIESVDDLHSPKGPVKSAPETVDLKRWLGVTDEESSEAAIGLIHVRVDELIYGDFPLLLLDILGRLRQFDDAITGLHESVQDRPDVLVPVYARLKPRRAPAKATTTPDGKSIDIELQTFQAEEGAKIELVLGLSRPLQNFEALKRNPPELKFFQGGNLVERPYLGFDSELSTETMLVYRIPKPDVGVGRIGVGTFTPHLILAFDYLPVLGRDNLLDYTFSVGTPRPNVQLITALRQPQPKEAGRDRAADPDEAFRGTLAADQLTAVVEVQVLAGASIQGARVTGVFQRFDLADNPIDTPTLTFLDDGIFPDLQANDGVYTRGITLQPNVNRKPGEYRIFLQADSTDQSKFIPVSEPIPVDPANEDKDKDGKIDPDKDPNKDLPKLPPFQRSTSLNFHVSGES